MEDGNKSFGGSGAQRSTPHSRPFFYVQPPSQPYYLYQHWQMSHPFAPYAAALPGGFNFSRPCLPPLQYMQYPGFMFPHAPVYPLDYRRAFDPRFQPPAWNQQQYQNQRQHQPPPPQPETASSEVQTDPSDAITKLMECLDKIRAGDRERELDSGVASQSSGMFSPGEEKKSEEARGGGGLLPELPDDGPAVVFSDSTTAVYDAESSHRSLDVLSPSGGWPGTLDEEEGEELPLDSSSLHKDGPEPERPVEDPHFLPNEEVSDILATDLEQRLQPPTFEEPQEPESRTGHRILKLPYERILTPGRRSLSSPAAAAAPYIYNYLSMQPTHERMSVLSPSLDELSSRDEMFSTDLDDVDLFPKHVYASRRLAEVVGVSPGSPADAAAPEELEEVWLPGARKFMCACCGKHLAKGAVAAGGRSKAPSSLVYRDEGGDSEDEGRYGAGCEDQVRVVVRRHSAPRKSAHSGPVRQKPWYRRAQYKNQDEGHDLYKPDAGGGDLGAAASGEPQCRSCDERVGRAELSPQEKNRWGDKEPSHRRRPGSAGPRQELSSQRKVIHHRPRDLQDHDDDEPPPLHWDRGSNMRGEPRC